MKVVLYLRYSSDKQTEQSIEGQMRVCKAFCEREGYTIVNTYIDRATSASKNIEKRVNFLQMIKDSDKQTFEAVVVYKLDRFARDRYDSATYKYRLKRNGVRLISATENISENPEGIILESVLEGMAEFYSKELSQKVRRGMRETALKCNSNGGALSLGYKIENHKFVVNPATAPIVQEAFRRYADGESVAEICRSFNARGLRTKTGAQFNKNSFSAIFCNRKYIGEYKFGDIVVPGGIPALVDEETFNKVQERLNRDGNAPRRGRTIVDYLLSQKLYCGHCGALMIGATSTSHTKRKYHYYDCSSHRAHKCKKRAVAKNSIERAVTADVLELLTPEMIENIADLAIKAVDDENNKNEIIPALKKEIQDCDRSIKRLFKLVEDGAESESLVERLKELEEQKKAATKRLKAEEAAELHLDRDQVVFFLTYFLKGDPDDPDVQRRVIDMLIRKVIVWDMPDGKMKLTYLCNITEDCSKEIIFSSENEKKHNISDEKAAQPQYTVGATNSPVVDLRRVALRSYGN